MSHYKPYPAYKDSGVEWLGRVPEHWAVCKLSFRYSIELGKMLDEKKLTKTSLVPYLRNQDVQWGSINTQDLPEMDIHPEELERYTIRDGDLLVCEGGDVGRAAIWRGENAAFGYQKALHRLRHRSSGTDTAEFFFFSLLTAKQRGVFEESDSKATIAHLPAEKFRQYRFAFPPLNEQQAIAAHLNRETARIDALVAKKTRFIELLREKRQALITHAVTKGLDSSVKMKDSGVEWLGEVPEYWAVCKLSFRYSIELGKMLDEKRIARTSLMPYLRNQDVQWDVINSEDLPEMDIHPEEVLRYTVRSGDLLVCEGGDIGRAAIWRGENDVFGYQKALHRLRPRNAEVDAADFFFFALMTAKARGVFEESDSKATIAHLPAEKFRQYRFAFPPEQEQREIAGYVRTQTARLDEILVENERSIELLKERRSALITAAVTGQIDLREVV